MRDLAAEFPNISEAIKLPEQTRGYQRKAADDARLHERERAPGRTRRSPYVRFDANNLPLAGAAPDARPSRPARSS